jgi:Cys-tRNA(Pro)/Cys-tRNA(Cys) deacylase
VTASGTRAIELVTRAGIAHRIHAYASPERHGRAREARPSYGSEAAEALGVEPGRIFKTLAVAVDGGLVLAVIPVDRELDLKGLTGALGGRRAVMAEPAAAERATGYVVGGISPIGSRRDLPVVIDASALGHDTILVSAGRRGLQLELAPGDLVRLCTARSVQITRDHRPG